jgi:hypothetical protein
MLVSHYINAFTTPAAAPAAAVESSVSAEVMQMVRDEHDLIVDYLKKTMKPADKPSALQNRKKKGPGLPRLRSGRQRF